MNKTTERYLKVKDCIVKETNPFIIKELEQLAEKLKKQRLKEMTWKNKDLLL